MADNINPTNDDLQDALNKQKANLNEQLFEYRDIANEATRLVKILNDDLRTRQATLGVIRNVDKLLRVQYDTMEDIIRGTRTLKELEKDRENVVKLINRLAKEHNQLGQRILKTQQDELEVRQKFDSISKRANQAKLHEKELLGEQLDKIKLQLTSYDKLQGILGGFKEDQEEVLKILIEEEGVIKQINKNLGIMPATLEGVDKILRKIGFGNLAEQLNVKGAINDTKESLREYKAKTGEFPGTLKTAGVLSGNLAKSISGMFTKMNLLTAAIMALVEGLSKADKLQTSLQQGFNLSREAARSIRIEFGEISTSSTSLFVTSQSVQESWISINESLGLATQLSGELLDDFTQFTKQAGFSKELNTFLTKIYGVQGKQLNESVKTAGKEIELFKLRNKLGLNTKKILEDITKISSTAAAIMGNQVDRLAAAASSAARLGASVSEVEQSAKSLLNFESSISAELEAQLMTGKDINLDLSRTLALQGKLPELADELKKQFGSLAEFQELNALSADSFATAMGLSSDQMATMLLQAQAMDKLSMEGAKTAQEAYNLSVKKYGIEATNAKLGDKVLADQLNAISNQEKWNALTTKLMDTFVQLADVMMPIFDLITDITKAIGFVLSGIIQGVKAILDLTWRINKAAAILLTGDFKGALNATNESTVFTTKPEDSILNKTFNNGKPIIPFAEGGMVTKPTLSMIGERGPEVVTPLNKLPNFNNKDVVDKLDQLISIVKEGKNIYMDSYQTGVAISLGALRQQ